MTQVAETSASPTPAVQAPAERMLITTSCFLPGYEITAVLGEVFGLTVRSRHIGSQFAASLKSVIGGELRGMTKNLMDARSEAVGRLVEEARAKGADAVVAFRFESNDLSEMWTEICAYGTAVKASRST